MGATDSAVFQNNSLRKKLKNLITNATSGEIQGMKNAEGQGR